MPRQNGWKRINGRTELASSVAMPKTSIARIRCFRPQERTDSRSRPLDPDRKHGSRRRIVAAQPMPKGFFPGGVYEQVQLSQLGLPDIHRERTNLGPWCQTLEFFRHGLGLVRQQVRKSQAMTSDILRKKVVEIHQRELSAACPRPSLDQHIRQISADRAASNNGQVLTCKRF